MAFSLSDIEEKNQLQLFTDEKNDKCQKLSVILDKIENKYGKGALMAGDLAIKSIRDKHKRQLNHREI